MAIPSGYSLVVEKAGNEAGPYSTFQVIVQIYAKDIGTGYHLYLRRFIKVRAGVSGFQGTIVTTTWGAGSYALDTSGNYAIYDIDWKTLGYGESEPVQQKDCKAYYTGSSYYESSVPTFTYTVPTPSYTVSYNANGGSGAPSSQTKVYGKTLVLSSTKPTRTGYTFLGWGTSSSDTTVDYYAGDNYTGNYSITLYAIWRLNSYSVSYNANGGTGAPSSQTKYYGTTLVLSKTKPTRTGYNFLYWNTKKDGTGTTYYAGANYTSNSAVTLYAIWSRIVLTITFDATTNGGSVSEKTRNVYYGNSIGSLPIATKKNYELLGWSRNPNTEDFIKSTDIVTESKTVYAIFKMVANCYIKHNGKYVPSMMYEKQINGEYKTGIVSSRKNGTYKESSM